MAFVLHCNTARCIWCQLMIGRLFSWEPVVPKKKGYYSALESVCNGNIRFLLPQIGTNGGTSNGAGSSKAFCRLMREFRYNNRRVKARVRERERYKCYLDAAKLLEWILSLKLKHRMSR